MERRARAATTLCEAFQATAAERLGEVALRTPGGGVSITWEVLILPFDWEPGGDELTPTMKLKRRPIAAKYAVEIEALYAVGGS
jgi:long-subunit acyl-CoA synthetase (AMP-forming)